MTDAKLVKNQGGVMQALCNHDLYLSRTLPSLFMLCCLFYYFGELVDFAGWEALRWDFWYGVHDVHRLMFLAPILSAAYVYRVKGAVIVTIATFFILLPRALSVSPYPDPMLRTVLFILAAGMMGALTGVARNGIERQRSLEAQGRAERDKLFSMLETMDDGVCIIDRNYKIRYMNSRMAKGFGEGVGLYCYELMHGFDSPCGQMCRHTEVMEGGTVRWEYAFPDGRTYEVVASPFVDSDEELCQLATLRNITERKEVEQELIRLSQLKSDLLSNVSHELKSPLTSIKGIVSSLLQKDITWCEDDQEMLLNGVLQETDRLTSLVTNLLNMSRLEAGVWKPEKERCHIDDIVQGAIEHLQWVNDNHVFGVQIEEDLPEILVDYAQIRQVLINLLENAVAYSAEGTQIVVEAKKVNGELEVGVLDHGYGMQKEDLERIFEKFHRGNDGRRKPGGTGLGLAICQAILLAHDGQIWAESEIGCGSAFRFRLPLAQYIED